MEYTIIIGLGPTDIALHWHNKGIPTRITVNGVRARIPVDQVITCACRYGVVAIRAGNPVIIFGSCGLNRGNIN